MYSAGPPDRFAAQGRSPVNWLFRAVLGFFAAPRVNMLEDYEKVRRRQRKLVTSLTPPTGATDHLIASRHGDHQIPVRMFQPKLRWRDTVLVFFHGGGWVTGDVDTYTPTCTRMATMTGCVVVSVDYRLAPEHPFPAGLEDCYDVVCQLLEEAGALGLPEGDEILLIGDSSGGNLAAAVSLLLRERGPRMVQRQILLYPVTHWDHDPVTSPFDSVREHGEDYRLTNAEVQDYHQLYLVDQRQRDNPLVAPLAAGDFSDQPDTLVVTAELDLLRDEAEAYGDALAQAGNTVQIHRVAGALHGFIALPRLSRSVREAYEVINTFLDDRPNADQQPRDGGTT